jgi:hypothetical protein
MKRIPLAALLLINIKSNAGGSPAALAFSSNNL